LVKKDESIILETIEEEELDKTMKEEELKAMMPEQTQAEEPREVNIVENVVIRPPLDKTVTKRSFNFRAKKAKSSEENQPTAGIGEGNGTSGVPTARLGVVETSEGRKDSEKVKENESEKSTLGKTVMRKSLSCRANKTKIESILKKESSFREERRLTSEGN